MIITTVASFLAPIGSANTAEEFTTGNYAWWIWLLVLGLVLLQIGLVTMYADRSEAVGLIGLVGFVAAFVSTALTLGYQLAFALAVPAVARVAPDQLLGTLLCCGLLPWVLTCLLFSVGFFLLGMALQRSRVYPLWATRVLMIGAVINVVPLPGTSLVLAVGLLWVGFVLFSKRAALDRSPALAHDENVGESTF